VTDGVTVMSLSANLLQKTSAAMDCLHQIAFSQKSIVQIWKKWYKFSSCIKAKITQKGIA